MRFKAQAGDVLHCWCKQSREWRKPITVVGFYCYGMATKEFTVLPFFSASFYAAGYHSGSDGELSFIYTHKKWHVPFARICERLRLSLPQWLAVRIGIERREI